MTATLEKPRKLVAQIPFAVGIDFAHGPWVISADQTIPERFHFAKIFLPRAYLSHKEELLKVAEGRLSENYRLELLG